MGFSRKPLFAKILVRCVRWDKNIKIDKHEKSFQSLFFYIKILRTQGAYGSLFMEKNLLKNLCSQNTRRINADI